MREGLIGFEFLVKTKVVNFTSRFNQIYCLPLFRSRQETYKKTHHCEWNHFVYELISTHKVSKQSGYNTQYFGKLIEKYQGYYIWVERGESPLSEYVKIWCRLHLNILKSVCRDSGNLSFVIQMMNQYWIFLYLYNRIELDIR